MGGDIKTLIKPDLLQGRGGAPDQCDNANSEAQHHLFCLAGFAITASLSVLWISAPVIIVATVSHR